MYVLKVNHRKSNGTQLMCPSYGDYQKDYKLTIGNDTSIVSENDGAYLVAAIDLINKFGNQKLDNISYRLLKTDANYRALLRYVKCLYPVYLHSDLCEGRYYGENEGKLRSIELVLEARWPWSINKMNVNGSNIEIKRLILKSEWVSQFSETLQCKIVTPNGQTINVPNNIKWTLSTINAVAIVIAGSYLKGFNWLGTFEGRIFNSGDDIDELIRQGFIDVE